MRSNGRASSIPLIPFIPVKSAFTHGLGAKTQSLPWLDFFFAPLLPSSIVSVPP